MSDGLAKDIVVQRATDDAAGPAELVLLFHGVGARAEDLVPLGEAIRETCPRASIVSVRAPDASSFGHGWQWFSVQGVTEANRPARIAGAMPRFVATIRAWQDATGIGPEATTLIGFSQGAIMSLESTQEAVQQFGAVECFSVAVALHHRDRHGFYPLIGGEAEFAIQAFTPTTHTASAISSP